MTAPSITHTFGEPNEKIDTNFSDLKNYLGLRNGGLAPWDTTYTLDLITKSPWYDVRAYSSINAAVSDIGSAVATLLVPSAQTLTANLTIPSTLTLWFIGSGSVTKASTYTLTINGPCFATDRQIFIGFTHGDVTGLQSAMPDWFGTGSAAFQSGIEALVLGGTLKLGAKTYTLATNVPINTNRVVIQGVSPEATQINLTPGSDGVTFFSTDGSLDNVQFRDFTLNQTNQSTYHNTIAISIATGDTRHLFERVFFTRIGKYGLYFAGGTYYMMLKECRFILIRDASSSILPTAVFSDGSNVFSMSDCFFGENDRDIYINGGAAIQIFNNNHEVGGDSGNTKREYFCQFIGLKNLWFANNYVEGNDTNGGAFMDVNNCVTPLIINNYFVGQDGPNDKTDNMIQVRGTSSRNVMITNNKFVEIISYFVKNLVPVKMRNNHFIDGNTELTTYAAIAPYIYDTTQLDLDIMGDYAASSIITGWTTPTAKIWFEKLDDIVRVAFEITGTSNATTVSFTLPFSNASDWAVNACGFGQDNTVDLTSPIYISMATSSTTVNVYKTFSAGGWTNVGTKTVMGQFFYKAA